MDPRTAIGFVTAFPVFDDQFGQRLVFLRARILGADKSFVVTAWVDMQNSVHGANPEDARMLLDEGILYRDSFAKYAAAFLRCRAPPEAFDSLLSDA